MIFEHFISNKYNYMILSGDKQECLKICDVAFARDRLSYAVLVSHF